MPRDVSRSRSPSYRRRRSPSPLGRINGRRSRGERNRSPNYSYSRWSRWYFLNAILMKCKQRFQMTPQTVEFLKEMTDLYLVHLFNWCLAGFSCFNPFDLNAWFSALRIYILWENTLTILWIAEIQNIITFCNHDDWLNQKFGTWKCMESSDCIFVQTHE